MIDLPRVPLLVKRHPFELNAENDRFFLIPNLIANQKRSYVGYSSNPLFLDYDEMFSNTSLFALIANDTNQTTSTCATLSIWCTCATIWRAVLGLDGFVQTTHTRQGHQFNRTSKDPNNFSIEVQHPYFVLVNFAVAASLVRPRRPARRLFMQAEIRH